MKLKNIADISFDAKNINDTQLDTEEVVNATLQPLPNNELVNQVIGLGLAKSTADMLIDAFLGQYNGFSEIAKKVEGLVVTDEREVELMQKARSARFALRDIRLAADATRKELKADALAYANAVQGIYNNMLSLISPLEEKLKYEEEFKKRAEAERAAKELQRREELLFPYMPKLNMKYISLGNMGEEEFEAFLADQKAKFEAAAREAEAAAIAEAAIREAEQKAAVEAANREAEIKAAVEAAISEAVKAAVEAANREAEMARQAAAYEAEEAAKAAQIAEKAAVEAAKGDKQKLLEWAEGCKASAPKVGKQYEKNVNELLNHIADFCETFNTTN